MISEEKTYNERIMKFKEKLVFLPFGQLVKKFPFLQGIPLSPFPRYQRCLGLTPTKGAISIRDRYVQVAFDLKMKEADESCLYSNFEDPTLQTKKRINYAQEWEKMTGKKPPKLQLRKGE